MTTRPARGQSSSPMREVACKDCQREIRQITRRLETERAAGRRTAALEKSLRQLRRPFTYSERWASGLIDRGGTRSDRCDKHRRVHRSHLDGLAVAHIDLDTIGAVADGSDPTGPLGGLGAVPDRHRLVTATSDLADFQFGMSDADIIDILELLRTHRVLILKAGTGTGKSTFAPYRLTDPPSAAAAEALGVAVPAEGIFDLASLGPVVVTEPRRQATIDVATFVGTKLSGAAGVGAGYPVGYQVRRAREHDDACQLIYVTDGTMLHWLSEGRLSRIGTVIVDEAHERSENIDLIVGFLKRNLGQYPHLRVIVTSATFNTAFWQEFFGGPDIAAVKEVAAVKSIGYGMPLFGDLDAPVAGDRHWSEQDILPLHDCADEAGFVERHWPIRYWPSESAEQREDLHDVTRRLTALRFTGEIAWSGRGFKQQATDALADFVVSLVTGLDREKITGDVLAFLPTNATIISARDRIRSNIGAAADTYALVATGDAGEIAEALRPRKAGEKRKVVLSTNIAETSLTVEGVRFVVDSGLIAQQEWDSEAAQKTVPTCPHSRAGVRQRWGRVGRKDPGWVFPLYSKRQYLDLAEDTPPGSTRANLESLVLKTRLSGIDGIAEFPWPAAFRPTTTTLDSTAEKSVANFERELTRADAALRVNGAVDEDGHPTGLGRELSRFESLLSPAAALAIMYADRLACVPEVATIVALLDVDKLCSPFGDALLLDSYDWPDEHRLEAATRHRGIGALAEDDAHFALLAMSCWESADSDRPPWEDSALRARWCNQWFINHKTMVDAANTRREVLAVLSTHLSQEVRRFVEPALLDRARLCISMAYAAHRYRRVGSGAYQACDGSTVTAALDDVSLAANREADVVALCRSGTGAGRQIRLSGLVRWVGTTGTQSGSPVATPTDLLVAAVSARPDPAKSAARELLDLFPVGQRIRFPAGTSIDVVAAATAQRIDPFIRTTPAFTKGRHAARARAAQDLATADDAAIEFQHAGPSAESDDIGGRIDDLGAESDGCGQCARCVAGAPEQCSEPSPLPETLSDRMGDTAEAIIEAQWGRRVRELAQRAPALVVRGEGLDNDGWYEVVGYTGSADGFSVVLEHDWRVPGYTGDPSAQPGTASGQVAHVTVGAMTSDHQSAVRIFHRTDRPGRFVLREADPFWENQQRLGQIAVSVDRSVTGQLEQLKAGAYFNATVVPSRARGCYTITLLQALRAHLDNAPTEVLDVSGRGNRFFRAVVSTSGSSKGKFEFTLLEQDVISGVRHTFRQSSRPGPSGTDAGSPSMQVGDPILVTLASAHDITLGVAGRSRAQIEDIVSRDNQLALKTPAFQGDALPSKAVLTLLTGGPLARASAGNLAALDGSPDWQDAVWSFWARSHHLRAGSADHIRSGTDTEAHQMPVPVTFDGATPEERKAQEFTEFAARYPEGATLTAEVGSVREHDAFLKLGPTFKGRLARRDINGNSKPIEILKVGDRIPVSVKGIDNDKQQVELSYNPLERFRAAHQNGDVVTGDVAFVLEHYVRIKLPPGAYGSVRLDEITGVPPRVGSPLTARITGFDDKRTLVSLTVKGVPADASTPTQLPEASSPADSSGSAAPPPASAPGSAMRSTVWQIRGECVVLDLNDDQFQIDHSDGRSVVVSKDKYLKDARPLRWLRDNTT